MPSLTFIHEQDYTDDWAIEQCRKACEDEPQRPLHWCLDASIALIFFLLILITAGAFVDFLQGVAI